MTVALIGALDCLTPGRMTPHEVAFAAQQIETEMLRQQCGIQDQLCSAYGGINYIEMYMYPHASVSPIQVPNSIWWELERRLAACLPGQVAQLLRCTRWSSASWRMPGRTATLVRTCAGRRRARAMRSTPAILPRWARR